MIVIVLGAAGQLGQAIQSISSITDIQFHFFDSHQLDITNIDKVNVVFDALKPDFFINAAA